MHLADGRRCERLLLEVLQLVPPAWAQVAADRSLQGGEEWSHLTNRSRFSCGSRRPSGPYQHLLGGHEVGTLTNALEDLGQLRVDEGVV